MSELRIIRGKDIILRADDGILFGVTEFGAVEKRKLHEVYECMSSKPIARIPQDTEYELKIKAMSMFDGQIPEDREFELRLRLDEADHVYTGCRTIGVVRNIKGDQNAETEYIITADGFLIREVEDEQL